MRARAVTAAVVAAGLVAGCSGGAPSAISAPTARSLATQVAAIRAGAAGDDPATARRDLSALVASLPALERQGKLSPDRGAAILAAAQAVGDALALLPTTTTTTSTTTTVPPAPAERRHGHDGQDQGGD